MCWAVIDHYLGVSHLIVFAMTRTLTRIFLILIYGYEEHSRVFMYQVFDSYFLILIYGYEELSRVFMYQVYSKSLL